MTSGLALATRRPGSAGTPQCWPRESTPLSTPAAPNPAALHLVLCAQPEAPQPEAPEPETPRA